MKQEVLHGDRKIFLDKLWENPLIPVFRHRRMTYPLIQYDIKKLGTQNIKMLEFSFELKF